MIVAYYRVSTRKQSLGLDAQRSAVHAFAAAEGMQIIAEFTEKESGKGSDALQRRPVLAEAMKTAKKARCAVAVAKLDRLSRDVHFISGLMAHKVAFYVTAFGRNVDPFTLHIYAALAEQERRMISQRTSAGLQAAKERGVVLGNPTLAAGNAAAAMARYEQMRPILLQCAGMTTRATAAALQAAGIEANAMTVSRARRALGL
jgi:DNA invertase Pin-like site-specific DNA recombinase